MSMEYRLLHGLAVTLAFGIGNFGYQALVDGHYREAAGLTLLQGFSVLWALATLSPMK